MPDPVVIPRADHPISRRDIDPDALKVLYRLHQSRHAAYLVGGSVRDLLLGRRPKDFDIGTDAHPYQIKRLFRNCWIIGRRFRLAHVKFGQKTIEVATFRRNVPEPPAGAARRACRGRGDRRRAAGGAAAPTPACSTATTRSARPEEDAFRRDFTINGLFYDIATFSVIDYVGGLGDLERRVIRSIGDPHVRFVEDPVRMLRAAVLAAAPGLRHGSRWCSKPSPSIAPSSLNASPARLMEEYLQDPAVGLRRSQLPRPGPRPAARAGHAGAEASPQAPCGIRWPSSIATASSSRPRRPS